MRREIGALLAVLLFVIALTSFGWASMEGLDPEEQQTSTQFKEFKEEMQKRMAPDMMRSAMKTQRRDTSTLQPSSPSSMMHMMGDTLTGRMMMDPTMMHRIMDREFFLDRSAELGLSQKQMAELKTIRSNCRKDNIRTAAEAKIARLELDDLLGETAWSLEEAEKLIRRIETLQGDMKVRHLQAVTEAEKVLSEEQLRKARMAPKSMQLEELF